MLTLAETLVPTLMTMVMMLGTGMTFKEGDSDKAVPFVRLPGVGDLGEALLGVEDSDSAVQQLQVLVEKLMVEQANDRKRISELEGKLEAYHDETIVSVAELVQLRLHISENMDKIGLLEEKSQDQSIRTNKLTELHVKLIQKNRDEVDGLLQHSSEVRRDSRRFNDYKERVAKRLHQLENKMERLELHSDAAAQKLLAFDDKIERLFEKQIALTNVTESFSVEIHERINETTQNISLCCNRVLTYNHSASENDGLSANQNSGETSEANQNSGKVPATNQYSGIKAAANQNSGATEAPSVYGVGSGEVDDDFLSILEERYNQVDLGSGDIQAELESSGEIDNSATEPTHPAVQIKDVVYRNYFQAEITKRDKQIFEMAEKYGNLTAYVEKLESRLTSIQLGHFMQTLQESMINFTQNVITLDQWKLASNDIVNSTLHNQDRILQLTNMILDNSDKVADLQWKISNTETLSRQQFNILRMFVIRLNNTVQDILEDNNRHQGRQSTAYQSGNQNQTGHMADLMKTLESRVEDIALQIVFNQNRLANLEVKVLNESLFQCKKVSVDMSQDAQLDRHQERISTNSESVLLMNMLVKELEHNINQVRFMCYNNTRQLRSVRSEQRSLQGIIPVIVNLQTEVEHFRNQLPIDCHEYYLRGYRKTDVYVIHPRGSQKSIRVYCEMSGSGGWTVIQRRFNGELRFNQNWAQFKSGFGSAEEEYWLGNDNIHLLTSRQTYSLQVEMRDLSDQTYVANYDHFSVKREGDNYAVKVDGFYGNSTDALSYSNNMAFSTSDRDNDASSTHCAFYYEAGWWYKHCQTCNLNGRYNIGFLWFNLDTNDWIQLRQSVMKIKPV